MNDLPPLGRIVTLPPEDPEVVYHYTSMDTLLKIVETPEIRATNVQYLNDTTEQGHFHKLVRQRLPVFIEQRKITETSIFSIFLHEEVSNRIDPTDKPFAASFSSQPDSLPQWRSYCSHGNGVSIGFRTECLKSASVPMIQGRRKLAWLNAAPQVQFGRVSYIKESETEKLDEAIASSVDAALRSEEESKALNPEYVIDSSDFFFTEIDQRACFSKDPSFFNEYEYRLLVTPIFLSPQYLNFRSSKSTLIPYVNVNVPAKAAAPLPKEGIYDLRGDDFINRVVIGPTPNAELSVAALTAFFRKSGLEVEVVSSEVPYRDL